MNTVLCFLFLFFVSGARADSADLYFRHISLMLRGQSPSPSEWAEFAKVSPSAKRAYLAAAAERFYDRRHVVEKLKLYFNNDLKTPYIPEDLEIFFWPENFSLSAATSLAPRTRDGGGLNHAIRSAVDKNLPWKLLHTGRGEVAVNAHGSDDEFFREINTPNFSGIFSTPEFFSKYYWSTEFRDTLRREAVLKSLLCLNPQNSQKRDTEDRSYLKKLSLNLEQTAIEAKAEVSAPSSDWFLGNEFRPTAVLNEISLSHNSRRTAASSLSGLVTKLTQTHEYAECQLKSLYRFWVSDDEELSTNSANKLRSIFRSGDISIKELVIKILLHGFDDISRDRSFESARLSLSGPKQFFLAIKSDFKLSAQELSRCRLGQDESETLAESDAWSPQIFGAVANCVRKIFSELKAIDDSFPDEDQWFKLLPSERRSQVLQLVRKVLGPETLSPSRQDKLSGHLVLILDTKSRPWKDRKVEALRDLVLTEDYRRL